MKLILEQQGVDDCPSEGPPAFYKGIACVNSPREKQNTWSNWYTDDVFQRVETSVVFVQHSEFCLVLVFNQVEIPTFDLVLVSIAKAQKSY